MNHEKQSIEQILNRNYGRTHLSEGEEWYVSNGRFLTLSQTKEHLLRKMKYIRKTLEKAHKFCCGFDDLIRETDINGNLFADTLELEEILSITVQLSEDFLDAYRALEHQENEKFRFFSTTGGS